MRFAITGGTGFVGRALMGRLGAEGHEVVAISRRTGADVGDRDSLVAAFEGCDGIAHCAGINRELGDQTYRKVHVQGTRNVVEAARRARVRKVVALSFLRARPDCGSPYHESKWEAEQIVRGSGLDFTVVKPGVIYGLGDHLLDHLSRALFTFPAFALVGMRSRPLRPTAVEDLALVLSAALRDARLSRKTVAVTGPESLELLEVVRRVGEAVGRRPLCFPMPLSFHYVLAWILERVMKVPLVSLAQVRILSESLAEPAGDVDELPSELLPRTELSLDTIQRGLPEPGPFRASDLACAPCRR